VPFRCGVFGIVSGFSVTLQNNRLGWIDIAPSMRRPASVAWVFPFPSLLEVFLAFEPSRLCRHPSEEKQKGNANRATLAAARKLVAYLVAVVRRQKEFLTVERENRTAA
jgi:hypothetical protein